MSAGDYLTPMFGDRLAPNGELVRDNFARWYGSAKPVDEAGLPLILYHGTTADVEQFDLSFAGSDGVLYEKPAIFATSDIRTANDYAWNKFDRIIADAMRALQQHKNDHPGDYGEAYETRYQAVKAAFKQVSQEGRAETGGGANVMPIFMKLQNPLVHDAQGKRFMQSFPGLIESAIKDGFDGVIMRNVIDHASPATEFPTDVYLAFRAEQIKSALGNSGLFLPASASLTDRLHPELDAGLKAKECIEKELSQSKMARPTPSL